MPHTDEASLIRDLANNFSDEIVQKFKDCIKEAKFWSRSQHLKQGSGDAFSNVMNDSGCNENLNRIPDERMRQRAHTCLNYYKTSHS